jgi:hypothetical protein
MELDLLERRIKRLVAKLAKQNIHLEVFDHNDIELVRRWVKAVKASSSDAPSNTTTFPSKPPSRPFSTILTTLSP